ncbi:MAG: hypothetical protein ABIY48_01940 [Acidimicrobiales bacterium]
MTVYNRPFAAALYDLDARLTCRLLWGTSIAEQARFAASTMDAAGSCPLLEVPVGTALVTAKARAASSARGLLVAVDLSTAMLRRARHRLGRALCT